MKSSRFTTLMAAVAAVAVLGTGMSGVAQASEGGAGSAAPVRTATGTAAAVDAAEEQRLAETLRVIEAMPDSVLEQGEEAAQAYLREHLPSASGKETRSWMQKLKCGAAITAAIAGGAVPVAKLLKLKAFIQKVGSVKQAASLLIRVAKGEEKISELSATLGGLAAAVLGIDAIKRHCR